MQQQVSPVQVNAAARLAILGMGVNMVQQIIGIAVDPAAQPVLNIQPQNVGLIKGFYIEVIGTITNTAGAPLARTGFGAANVLSRIQYNDLQNNVRINTSGAHMAFLDAARQGFGYGGAYAPNLPIGLGNNYPIQSAPAAPAASADAAIRFTYYVPLAYAEDDFRGAVYSAVTTATQNLQLTINATPVSAAGDPTQYVYTGNPGGWKAGTKVTVNVYQSYIDQIPRYTDGPMKNQPILPVLDLNTIYELKDTTVTGVTANSDYGIPFGNYRNYLSTFATYDQNGVLSAGDDVNYWSIQSANFTNLIKASSYITALRARGTFMADPPAGTYFFDTRKKPIDTVQFGNMQLVLNALTAAAGSKVIMWYEAFAYTQSLQSAQSLPSG
jgi:hypothetical protein